MKRSQSRTDAGNDRVVASGVSRRELIAAGGAMAAAATSSPLIANTASAQGSAGADATLDRLRRAAGDSGRRILIRGGTVISLDAGGGDFAAGDGLIEDGTEPNRWIRPARATQRRRRKGGHDEEIAVSH